MMNLLMNSTVEVYNIHLMLMLVMYLDIEKEDCGNAEEGIDENDEYEQIISNEVGFYFQTKTVPKRNKKFEIITAARFDKHDMLDEGIQFSPKFGLFYKPNNFQTFRMTYGKAFNTPTAINLATDLFIGKRGFVDYYLRGNTNGTPYQRVGEEFVSSYHLLKLIMNYTTL